MRARDVRLVPVVRRRWAWVPRPWAPSARRRRTRARSKASAGWTCVRGWTISKSPSPSPTSCRRTTRRPCDRRSARHPSKSRKRRSTSPSASRRARRERAREAHPPARGAVLRCAPRAIIEATWPSFEETDRGSDSAAMRAGSVWFVRYGFGLVNHGSGERIFTKRA